MKVEEPKIKTIKITEVEGLDPITVHLEDIKPREGKITITCFGESWSAWWGGMGNCTISQFFINSSSEYLIGKLSSINHMVVDYENLDKHFKKDIIRRRRYIKVELWEEELSKEEARELWNLVESDCENDEFFLNSSDGYKLASKILGEDWFRASFAEIPNYKYEYLERIVKTVQTALEEIK